MTTINTSRRRSRLSPMTSADPRDLSRDVSGINLSKVTNLNKFYLSDNNSHSRYSHKLRQSSPLGRRYSVRSKIQSSSLRSRRQSLKPEVAGWLLASVHLPHCTSGDLAVVTPGMWRTPKHSGRSDPPCCPVKKKKRGGRTDVSLPPPLWLRLEFVCVTAGVNTPSHLTFFFSFSFILSLSLFCLSLSRRMSWASHCRTLTDS